VHPPLRTTPVVRALNAAHGGQVCSTWGDFHYKTFDGDVFRFPGLCNYVFSAHCGAAYEDFNIQLRRGPAPNATAPSRVTMKLDGMVVELTKSSVLVNGRTIQLPFSQSGVLVEQSSSYVKVVARLGLVFLWNQDDSLLLELDAKYANKTCGLCGDFNGIPVFNEFLSHDVRLSPIEFGNLQKMDGPMEQCQDPVPESPVNCSTSSGICKEMLSELFPGCAALVDASSYLNACQHDLCRCQQANLTSCLCHTLAEYSRQCAHAGGQPLDWRGPHLCPQTCPQNTEYRECGSPCADTCSNLEHSQLCEDHCVAGCFCPKGMVLDDVGHTGCISVSECSCVYNGVTYAPGTGYSTDCSSCTCSGGRWSCQEVPCPGTCSVLGGAHFSTFDEREYTVHGDCSYVLAKPCNSSAFTVLAELRRCGLTDSETCLKSLTLSLAGGQTVIVVKASGEVFVNQIYTQLPVSTANVMLFRPSTFFIIAQTQLGLQLDVQLVPVMQVFVRLAPQLRGHTCGLCGNFNSIQADDFRTISGLVEGTAAAFANTWKTQAACPNIKNNFEDPCSLSVENEKYAQHWCSRLTDTHGPFARCHAAVNPSTYYSNCMFDTCNCEKSEDCMCAALSSYVRACAARGVLLSGWRDGVCTTPTATCPKSLTYRYHISTCQATCRARSDEGDATCSVSFVPVDGCTCSNDTFLDDTGKCVPATSCPCYYRGSVVPNGESLHDGGAVCTCTQGTLACIGGHDPTPVCVPPMVYFDCRNATPGATGAGCQKSCHTLDMDCYSSQCVPGCVCPSGLVASGEGGCIPASDCPCVHNEASYPAGQTIRVGCNTCTCKNRTWQCTDQPCLATCAVYGDGHYLTFDGQRYSFSGDCEYTLVQDHCSGNGSAQDGFRVITENIPCGTTGTTCSKAIKLFLGSDELKLSDGKVEVIETDPGQPPPFAIRQMGIYLVVDTDAGLVLLWDKKTSIFLTLSPEFKGRVCGLCGNFDGNALNDFTTRSQSVVGDVLEFGNSWKFSPSCPDARAPKDPCTANPYRKSWAQKQCSIINSATFSACRAHVEPARYYEACVSDACACDTGGDCECFCTAVAAYAQACHEVGVCVSWRTPDICPLFCDYYNPQGQCEWHYLPCGAPCMRTCRNPRGQCLHDIQGLEGCYPKCPPEAPIFDEDQMHCVTSCPTPPPPAPCRVQGKTYRPGSTVPSDENCHSCVCTVSGVQCTYDPDACVCTYDGRRFRPGEVIYHTSDGTGGCISARCGANGTIDRGVSACSPATPTPQTTFVFSTSPLVVSSTLPPSTRPSPATSSTHTPSRASLTTPGTPPGPTPHCGEECLWSPWLDVSRPGLGIDSGDFDTLENLRAHGYRVCRAPSAVECQAEDAPGVPLRALGQRVECSPTVGLICYNRDQPSGHCDNYQIRILCCSPRACPPGTSGFTSVLTGSTASSVPVTMTGPTTVPTTSITPGPGTPTPISGTSTPGPGSPTPAPGSPTPAPGTSTSGPGTPTPGPGTPTPAPGTSTSGPGTPTPPSPVTCLQESCTWTKWIDGSYPGPDRNSGDFDTFQNLRAKGYRFCAKPVNVECRAESFPDTPLQALGQDVICDKTVGLVCLNKDQLPPICYNYEIRILCCEMVDTCLRSTTEPFTPESTRQSSSAWTPGVVSPSTQHSTATSGHTPTASSITSSWHGPTPPSLTPCRPQCSWSKWFDVDFPSPGPHGGDFETYSNILRSGEKICRQPEYISDLQCRAQNHPEVSIQKLGQVVECRPEVGLVCRNQDQGGKFRICLNYEVRVLCCEPKKDCPVSPITLPTTTSVRVTSPPETSSHGATSSTTSVQPSSSSSPPISSTTSVQSSSSSSAPTTSSAPISSTTSVQPSSSSSAPTTRATSVQSSSSSSAPISSTTSVQPSSSGSVPTTSATSVQSSSSSSAPTTSATSVRSSSSSSTPIPSTISVQPSSSSSAPTTSATSVQPSSSSSPPISSTVSVQPSSSSSAPTTSATSVQPSSSSSPPIPSTISVQPSSSSSAPTTSATSVQPSSSSSPPISSTVSVQTSSSSSVPTTSTTSVQPSSSSSVPTTSATSVRSSSSSSTPIPSTTSVQPSSSSSAPTTSATSVQPSSSSSTPIPSTTSVQPSSSSSAPTTSATSVQPSSSSSPPISSTISVQPSSSSSSPTTSTTSVQPSSSGSAPTTSATSVQPSSSSSPPISSTISVQPSSSSSSPTTSTTSVPTPCQPQCSWSKWFDVDFPSPGPHGGDFETYSNILRSGEKICRQPEYISDLQCRAQNHPEVSIQKLGQVVECRPEVGLVCRNQDQGGKFRICLNYEVRVLCCDSTPIPSTTSVQPSSSSSAPTTSATSVQSSSSSSAPTTSATSTSVPGSTSSSRSPTPCRPQCSWSKWFDVDFPSPGPHGGDFETYSNILRSGEKICRQPEYISDLQCRAQNHPEVSIQKLGQVVECRPEVGLVCRNQDQGGKFRICLNYEVRVLCCEPKKDCPVSPITLPTTTSVRVTSPPETSSHGATSSTTSTCYCSVSDRLYPAGSIIYEETDLSGHCYYAVCSLACRVVRRTDLSCPTSRPPPASSTPRPGGRALQLTLLPQKGETWPMPNCTEASCEGNGVISVRPRHCPKVQKPTCANGYPAVKVQRGRPVEPCWCVCSGWGDPHYITFDGTYYTFLDNCTYVLVQQIVPVYGHFRVLVDNYFCGAEDGLSCPQSIIVEYQQDRVVLTRRPVRGVMTNQIIFNNEVVSPGFRKDGIVVSQVGIKMYVAIPEIGVQVMFSGLIFSVEVPFSKFANNTEGQCGTCTNDQKDECRLPGGAVVASCSDMSSHWKVTLPGQPPCHAPPPRPTVVEPTTPPTSCPPSPICQLILSEVFAPCHAEIPPWPFFQGCVFDHCHMPDTDVLCSGLELYAALCASLGVCIDWRGRTNHTCPFPCPADTVYQPCGPSNPPYSPALTAGSITEGCFCPQGTMRFSTGSEVCVPADCSWCLGPHGEPVEPGHTVSFDCQECSCDGHTRTVSCRSQTCPLPPACQEPGLVPVPEALQSGQCCPQYSCACNTTRCPVPVECPEGSHLVLTYEEGACCPSYNWTSCSVNGTLYQPGAVVSSTLCETCRCEVPGGPESDTFAISCETQICSTYCPVGFEYQERQGQCCGFCKQVACVTNTSDSSVHLFYPGESWSDPGNRCVTHECEKHQEGLVVVTTRKACPPLTCPGGQAGADLGTPLPPACSSPGCAVYHQHQVLQQQSCRSAGPVRLTYCQGNCGDTASMYSPEANAVEHRCKCCQELQVALRNVTLHCPDGSSRAFSYTEVEKCGCVGQRCDSHGDLSLSEEEAPQLSRDAGHGLWRTGAPQPRPLQ
uniref:Mucin 5AC, oligomeric mucus/gel-forming n=1 Tax=Sus scrofa TaxID=9823 RepID=A0A287ANG4_PIG